MVLYTLYQIKYKNNYYKRRKMLFFYKDDNKCHRPTKEAVKELAILGQPTSVAEDKDANSWHTSTEVISIYTT